MPLAHAGAATSAPTRTRTTGTGAIRHGCGTALLGSCVGCLAASSTAVTGTVTAVADPTKKPDAAFFPEYPKIETLYDRDPANMKRVVPGLLRRAEFGLIDRWLVTEKIDGTNVRIQLQDGQVRFGGRTGNAQMPVFLLDHLTETFSAAKVAGAFDQGTSAVLFGEGYGARIQKGGGLYRSGVSFRLFDVAVLTERWTWWLAWDDVRDVASKLGIATVPVLAEGVTTEEAIAMVKLPSETAIGDGGEGTIHEGIVARSEPLLLTRDGKRLLWKLKGRDLDG